MTEKRKGKRKKGRKKRNGWRREREQHYLNVYNTHGNKWGDAETIDGPSLPIVSKDNSKSCKFSTKKEISTG